MSPLSKLEWWTYGFIILYIPSSFWSDIKDFHNKKLKYIISSSFKIIHPCHSSLFTLTGCDFFSHVPISPQSNLPTYLTSHRYLHTFFPDNGHYLTHAHSSHGGVTANPSLSWPTHRLHFYRHGILSIHCTIPLIHLLHQHCSFWLSYPSLETHHP